MSSELVTSAVVAGMAHGKGGVMAPALKKAATKSKAAGRAAKEPERRPLHRVGTHVHASMGEPTTIGSRMAKRRLELGMTQETIASQIVFTPKTGKREFDEVTLSRNGYGMYETGQVEPDLDKIVAIAKALGVTPQWLAFGVGERPSVEEFVYDPGKKAFVTESSWLLSEQWISDNFSLNPTDIGLYVISDYSANFQPGNAAIVQRNVEPTAAGGEFIFAFKGRIKVAHVTKPQRSDNIRIFAVDNKTHEEVSAKQIVFLGEVIGKLGSLRRG